MLGEQADNEAVEAPGFGERPLFKRSSHGRIDG
jgi:hypothetical protein